MHTLPHLQNVRSRRTSTAAALAVLLALPGCSLFAGRDDVQVVVTKAAVGMSAGEFFSRHGPGYNRTEQLDETTTYDWASAIGGTVPGPNSLDERVCRLHLIVDAKGRIIVATIRQDNPGRVSTSRCTEIFTGRQDVTGSRPQT